MTYRPRLPFRPLTGRRAFYAIWAGQLVSILGTRMTGFALSVWVYQHTGSVTKYSIMLLATVLPEVLFSPLAGTLVDRWNRRKVMLLGDAGSALTTLCIAALLYGDSLELWSLALLRVAASLCETMQTPAFFASVPLLVPKAYLGKANGLIQLGGSLPRIVAPILAGVLVASGQVWNVLLIDFCTFLMALVTLSAVRVPRPAPDATAPEDSSSLLSEVAGGWRYLRARPGLMAILWFFVIIAFTIGTFDVVAPILILSFASVMSMGTLLSLAGFGLVGGSLAMSLWGGPARRVDGVLGFSLPFGVGVALVGVYPSVSLVAAGVLLMSASMPIVFGCSQALLQAKVPGYLLGRVFALRELVMSMTTVVALVAAGPLADRVLEPLLSEGGPLAGSLGRVLGVGPGRGAGLLLVMVGILPVLATVFAWFNSKIRKVEDDVPDAILDDGPTEEPSSVREQAPIPVITHEKGQEA